MTNKNNGINPLAALILTMGVVFIFVFESWLGYPLTILGAVMVVLNSRF